MSCRTVLTCAGLALALFGATAPAWAETVVLRASGPSATSFAPGEKLPDAAQIKLIEGDSLSVLSSGGTVLLQGPYTGPVGGSASAKPKSFDWLASLKASPRTRAAGSRGPATQALASN